MFNHTPGVPHAIKTMQGIKRAERHGGVDSDQKTNLEASSPAWRGSAAGTQDTVQPSSSECPCPGGQGLVPT